MNDDAVDRSPEALAARREKLGLDQPETESFPLPLGATRVLADRAAEGKDGVRKKRADAGKPRAVKALSVRNTEFQWRVEELMQAERTLVLAQLSKDRAWAEYCSFVDKALGC